MQMAKVVTKALNEHRVNPLYQDLVRERYYKSHLQFGMRISPGIELLWVGAHWGERIDLDIHLEDVEGLCRLSE